MLVLTHFLTRTGIRFARKRFSGFSGIDVYPQKSGAGATAAPATGGRALLGASPTAGFVDLAIDPDDRQDHDRSRPLIRRAIHRRSQPRSRICRKRNHGAHAQSLLAPSAVPISAATRRDLEPGMVNGLLKPAR
jgi:hypothetical protein